MGGRLARCNAWAGEVRGMELSNQERHTSQEPVRPASWQRRQRHKPHCYVVRMPWAMSGSHARRSGFRKGKRRYIETEPDECDFEVLLVKLQASDSCDVLGRGWKRRVPSAVRLC